jgi:outer membrane lipoprotein-sorting protein
VDIGHAREVALAVEHVFTSALGDGGHLGDQLRGNVQVLQALAQKLDNGIEMKVVQAAGHQMRMPAPHIGARVVMGSAECHGEKGLLPGGLAIHIGAFEKRTDTMVGKNLPVENIYGRVNSGFASQLLIEGRFVGVENGVHNYASIMHSLQILVNSNLFAMLAVMRQAIAFGLFAFFSRGAFAQAKPDAAEILKKVANNYKTVSTYEFKIDSTENGSASHMEFAFQSPDKYRIQGAIPGMDPDKNFSEGTITYDGSVVWFYLPKLNQYGSFPSAALTTANSDLGDLKPEFVDEALMGRYRRAADFVGGAKLLREESIEIAGAKVLCYVVTVSADTSETPYTWWIDKTRFRILREDHKGTRALFTTIKLDEPVREELFKFEPPPGAQKLQ